MVWTSRDDSDPAIVLGRRVLGAAFRQARLAHALSQRQLGWYVGYDQSTISRLETAKLKGMKFKHLARMIGILASGDAFDLPLAPRRAPRRLPGERDPAIHLAPGRDAASLRATPSYDADGHALGHTENEAEFGSSEDDDERPDAG